jgi:hypothetical protein
VEVFGARAFGTAGPVSDNHRLAWLRRLGPTPLVRRNYMVRRRRRSLRREHRSTQTPRGQARVRSVSILPGLLPAPAAGSSARAPSLGSSKLHLRLRRHRRAEPCVARFENRRVKSAWRECAPARPVDFDPFNLLRLRLTS